MTTDADPSTATALGGGVGVGLASAAAFGTSGPFAKSLLDAGWSPGGAVTARIVLAALVLLGPALVSLRGRWGLVRSNARMIVAFGVFAVAGCQLCYFNAVQTLSVGVALLLEYLGVILVVLWLWARHDLRPRRTTVAGMALAVAGLVLVLDVMGGARVDAGGVLWGLGAAVGLAVYFTLSARDATGLPPLVMSAGGLVVAAVVLGAAGLVGLLPMESTAADTELAGVHVPWFVPVLAVGVLSTALAYALGITSARRLGSKVAAFLGLTEVLFAVVAAWLLLDELPLAVQLAGGVLIVAGVAVVRYEELSGAPSVGAEALPDPAT